jgi:hypothetical protein
MVITFAEMLFAFEEVVEPIGGQRVAQRSSRDFVIITGGGRRRRSKTF